MGNGTTAGGDERGGGACVVLLSSYNGAPFLDQQLASIARQTYPDIRLIVRDDGSTDATRDILRAHARPGAVDVYQGDNLGAGASFFDLLHRHGDADIVMFSDQDDVWFEDKVARAAAALAKCAADVPALYCSRVALVDEGLVHLGHSPLWPRPPGFGNALVENVAMGCTIALNRAAASLIHSRPAPRCAIMHDWWCYLVTSAFGEVVYDPEPTLLYRIHGANTVGMPTGFLQWSLAKVKRQLGSSTLRRLTRQAEEFARLYGADLSADQLSAIDALVGTRKLRGRLNFLREARIHRQFASDDFALRLLVLARGG